MPTTSTINLTRDDDTYTGSNMSETVNGGAGDDNIATGTGDDTLLGGDGDDVLAGNVGDDILKGDAGDDIIIGGVGADSLAGGRGNDTIIADDDDVLVSGGNGFDILKLTDSEGDNVVDFDMTTASVRGMEAIVGDFETITGNEMNITINLSKILSESDDDGDAATPDTDNTFIAVGVDSLILGGGWGWTTDGNYDVDAVDLNAAEEASYIEMLGINRAFDLHSYTFTKNSGEEVTLITDLSLADITDGYTGDTLDIDTPV